MEKIDFVILWVDGNDENWIKEKRKYDQRNKDINNSDVRFRDWEFLKFWFRCVEKYADWVNKIYFITWGHVPEWLNTSNEKIKIVKHSDFIPMKYLPTYSSDVIEMNLFRIKELNEKFVLFNDDFFLTDYVKPEFFFKKNLPVDIFSEDALLPINDFTNVCFNNEKIINKHFEKRLVQKRHFFKLYNIKYGKYLFRNILLSAWGKFSSFKNLHLPQAFRKSNFEKVWELEQEELDQRCINKFRSKDNLSQYLIRDWQLCSGEFYPSISKRGKYFDISDNNFEIYKAISKRKYKMICLNDGIDIKDFEKTKKEIIKFFEKTFPQKSNFEK